MLLPFVCRAARVIAWGDQPRNPQCLVFGKDSFAFHDDVID